MTTIAGGAVSGGSQVSLTAVSGVTAYSILSNDEYVQVTTSTNTVVVTFPAPSKPGTFTPGTDDPSKSTVGSFGNTGQRVHVQKVDSGNGTVSLAGLFNIGTFYSLASQWSAATFVCDGTRWNLVATVS